MYWSAKEGGALVFKRTATTARIYSALTGERHYVGQHPPRQGAIVAATWYQNAAFAGTDDLYVVRLPGLQCLRHAGSNPTIARVDVGGDRFVAPARSR